MHPIIDDNSDSPGIIVDNSDSPDIIVDEFDSLFRRDYPGLCRYAWRIVHNQEDAAEIVQETFLRFHAMRTRGETSEASRVLLYRIARNLAIDCLRRRTTRKRYEATNARIVMMPLRETVEQELLTNERHSHLRDALRQLKSREVECLALKNEGHSYGDIAQILNIHPGSVGQTITRALRKLRVAYLELTRARERVNDGRQVEGEGRLVTPVITRSVRK